MFIFLLASSIQEFYPLHRTKQSLSWGDIIDSKSPITKKLHFIFKKETNLHDCASFFPSYRCRFFQNKSMTAFLISTKTSQNQILKKNPNAAIQSQMTWLASFHSKSSLLLSSLKRIMKNSLWSPKLRFPLRSLLALVEGGWGNQKRVSCFYCIFWKWEIKKRKIEDQVNSLS